MIKRSKEGLFERFIVYGNRQTKYIPIQYRDKLLNILIYPFVTISILSIRWVSNRALMPVMTSIAALIKGTYPWWYLIVICSWARWVIFVLYWASLYSVFAHRVVTVNSVFIDIIIEFKPRCIRPSVPPIVIHWVYVVPIDLALAYKSLNMFPLVSEANNINIVAFRLKIHYQLF